MDRAFLDTRGYVCMADPTRQETLDTRFVAIYDEKQKKGENKIVKNIYVLIVTSKEN